MEINPNAVENIVYEKSFVAYLDILGFTNLVFDKSAEAKEKLNRYFGIVNSVIGYLKDIQSKKEIGSIVISDSIILSVPQSEDKKENLDKLRQLLIAVGLIQKELAIKDIWLRGAVSSGDTYFNSTKSQVVGPAYINAFLLEGSVAVSPRIIVDSKIINEFNFSNALEFIHQMNLKNHGGLKYSNWGKSILFNWNDPDGKSTTFIKNDIPLFIDYLSPIMEEHNDDLIKIIKNLENNIYKDSKNYVKYRWVADYLKSLEMREHKNNNKISRRTSYRLSNL